MQQQKTSLFSINYIFRLRNSVLSADNKRSRERPATKKKNILVAVISSEALLIMKESDRSTFALYINTSLTLAVR